MDVTFIKPKPLCLPRDEYEAMPPILRMGVEILSPSEKLWLTSGEGVTKTGDTIELRGSRSFFLENVTMIGFVDG